MFLALSAVALAGKAAADPTANPQKGEEIIITGSRIPRPNLTAVSPITVVTDKEVRLQGAVLTENLINALPQLYPDQGLYLSNGSTGTAAVDLRGFGPARTLVLVNGRRLLPGGANYPAADINFVPTALIKRVEVLTGGASSVYGSDAVAGVVNFILDTRLEGMRIQGQSSFYQHDNRNDAVQGFLRNAGFSVPKGNAIDGAIDDINAAYGVSFGANRGHLTVYGGFRRAFEVAEAARDYSACTVQVEVLDDAPHCGGSLTSGPGNFTIPLTGIRYQVTADRRFVPGSSLFNFAPYNFYQRPDRRYTAGGFADFEINGALKPYAEFMYMDDSTVAQIAPSGAFTGAIRMINCDSPLLSAQQLALVCVNGNFVGQRPIIDNNGNLIGVRGTPTVFSDPTTHLTYLKGNLRATRRDVEGGPRRDESIHRDLRLIGGLKGSLGRGITYDASYLYARVKQFRTHTNDLLVSRIANATNVVTDPSTGQPVCRSKLSGADPACLPWDIFALNAATGDSAAYLAEPSNISGRVEEQVANGYATVDLGAWGVRSPWADEAPGLNLGAEYRRDKLSLNPDEHYRDADLVGFSVPVTPLSGVTSVKELFGELRVPVLRRRLIEELTLEGGYRLSWYRNADHRFSSASYKLGAEFAPIRDIRFRGSLQRAVRAPDVQDLFAVTVNDGFDRDPCAGPTPPATQQQCALTGVTTAQYGDLFLQPDTSQGYNGIGGGDADLRPEVATTTTVGAVLRPSLIRRLSLTIDWFDIRLKGAIGVIGTQQIMDTCIATGDPTFCGRIHRDSNGSLWETPQGYIDDRNANIGALKTSGLDVDASYTQPLGRHGSLDLELQGTWTRRFIIDNGGLSTPYNCAGIYGGLCGVPLARWRHNARITWDAPRGLTLSLLWRHTSAAPTDAAAAKQLFDFDYNSNVKSIPSQDLFDLAGVVKFGERYQLRAGVRNVFDKQPPNVLSGQFAPCGGAFCNGNTYPQLYDPLGRFIFFGATVNFKPI